jgi:hypothetical protein
MHPNTKFKIGELVMTTKKSMWPIRGIGTVTLIDRSLYFIKGKSDSPIGGWWNNPRTMRRPRPTEIARYT